MKNIKEQLEQIKKFYDELPDELFKQRLIEAGFEIIENSNGEFIYIEYDEEFEKNDDPYTTMEHSHQALARAEIQGIVCLSYGAEEKGMVEWGRKSDLDHENK